jgi:hypothetical protein
MVIGMINAMKIGVVYEMTTNVERTLRAMLMRPRKFNGIILSVVSISFENLKVKLCIRLRSEFI